MRLDLKAAGGLLLSLALSACTGETGGPPSKNDPDPPPGTGAIVTASTKANLRFKGPERLSLDLSAALELNASTLCNELGRYSCTGMVHKVALGGVDPYEKSVYEAPATLGVTAPIAIERVTLTACLARVEADLASPGNARIFRNIPLINGKLADPSGAPVQQAVVELARRAWARDPSAFEVTTLVTLARDLEAQATPQPAKTWMQAACFAVFSSTEAVFY